MTFHAGTYDAIVLGAGHAGCEAALALARMGKKTLCLTMNLDAVALMACNPAIGGTSKGHLVCEIDALGGEMGLAADDTFLQIRMLNTGKGPAVHSLRAQIDKRRYHERMKRALECEENITLRQGECERILVENGHVCGVVTDGGATYFCRALVVATGVYLKSRILVGDHVTHCGPSGLVSANALSTSLTELNIPLRRFKTGTPARVHRRSLDFRKMERQDGDTPAPCFSFLNKGDVSILNRAQIPCYLTYTNVETHRVILENIHRSAMYSGLIEGTGTRYCPSIEDKIKRFQDKDRHQLFLEPEGLTTDEMYVQGLSTSLPFDVQEKMLKTISGMENCEIMRAAYAIEYDCIDPLTLGDGLSNKDIQGLYFAGQVNGTSGYEEAAAQGLYAGVNAGLFLKGEPPLTLTRADAYIGVLVDDLTVKGTNEPYRMMTSRAEYRLLLRQDNADIRLTELARRTGLISDARYDNLMRKNEEIERANTALNAYAKPDEALKALFLEKGEGEIRTGLKLSELLKRESISYLDLVKLGRGLPEIGDEAREQVEIAARYDGYIKKQFEQVKRFEELESTVLPDDMDYFSIGALRIEARQKLSALRPKSIGQASRISGVSPADIAVLLIKLKKDAAKAPEGI
ncbi:MAG TPA: tRNA uridine-5-carboxymethylaminomethyl(34) synthesis enzyme MnmG [Clostridia bacterium]|nr:tRNA uridine-5-carboxymethylaminomethyl(34) synthesis enzyme MnmG [Clostridia bacterium]